MTIIKSTIGAAIIAVLSFAAPAQAAAERPVADFSTCKKPDYPAASLAAKHQGTVALGFLVDATGSVLEAKVNKSSGYEPLDNAARDAIKLCKFTPAQEDGKAVQAWANVRYVWVAK